MKEKRMLYTQFKGVNNIDAVDRLHQPTREDPSVELSVCDNALIDTSLRLVSRPGQVSRNVTSTHSLWSSADENRAFCVQDEYLCSVSDAYGTFPLVFTGTDKVSFTEIGQLTLFTNPSIIGVIRNGTYYPFPAPETNKWALSPGQLILYHNGRTYVAVDDHLRYSEGYKPFQTDYKSCARKLGGYITLLAGVADGLYVGFDNTVLFLSGKNPDKFQAKVVLRERTLMHSVVYVDGHTLNVDAEGKIPLWISEGAVYAGLPEGVIKQLSYKNYKPAAGTYGAGVHIEHNRNNFYLSTIY